MTKLATKELKLNDKGHIVPEIQMIDVDIQSEIDSVDTSSLNVEAPTQVRFNIDPEKALVFFTKQFGITCNGLVKKLEANEDKPANASAYVQGHGYITFSGNGSLFLKAGSKTHPIGSFDKDGKFSLRVVTNPETGEVVNYGEKMIEVLTA